MKKTVFVSFLALVAVVFGARANAEGLVLTEFGSPVTEIFFSSVDVYDSQTRTLTLSNASAETAELVIQVGGFGFHGEHDCPTNLAAGANCTISVTFTPTFATGYSGVVSVSGYAASANSYLSVDLSGFGRDAWPNAKSKLSVKQEASDVALATGYVDFGSVRVMDYAYRTLRLSNDSGMPVSNLQLYVLGHSFGGRTDCGFSLAPGGSCRVQLEFHPWNIGGHYGSLDVYVDGTTQLTVDLYGWGTN